LYLVLSKSALLGGQLFSLLPRHFLRTSVSNILPLLIYTYFPILVDPRDSAALKAATPSVIAARLPSPPGTPQADNLVFIALFKNVGYVYTSNGAGIQAGAALGLPSATWWAEASFIAKSEDFFVLAANTGIYKYDLAGQALGNIVFEAPVAAVAVGLDPEERRLYAAIPGKVFVATLGSATEQLTKVAETTFATELGAPTTVWFNHYNRNEPSIVVTSSSIVNSQRRNYAFKCTAPASSVSCDTLNKYQFDKDYIIKSATSPAIQPPRPQGATGVYYSAEQWAPTVYYLDDDENAIGFNVSAMSQNEVYRSSSIVDGGKLGNWFPSQSFAVVPESGQLYAWALYRDFVGNGTSIVLTYTLFPPRDLWLNQNNNGANRNVADVERGWLIGGIIAAVIVVVVLVVAIILIVRRKKLKGTEAPKAGAPSARASTVADTPRGSVVSLDDSE
jgi:hypothetical protein